MNVGLSDFGSLKHYMMFFLVVKISNFCYLGINECPGTLRSQDGLTLGSIQDLASLRRDILPYLDPKRHFRQMQMGNYFPTVIRRRNNMLAQHGLCDMLTKMSDDSMKVLVGILSCPWLWAKKY